MPSLARVAQASFGKNAPGSPHILKLVAVASSPEDAKNFLVRIIETLAQDHGQVYKGYSPHCANGSWLWSNRFPSVRTQMGQLSGAADRLMSSRPVQASLLALEKGRLVTQLSQLEQDRFNLRRQISDPFSASTCVLTPSTLPNRPSHPGIVFTGAVGTLLGLALGIVAAFLRDLYSNVREAQNSPLSSSRPADRDQFQ